MISDDETPAATDCGGGGGSGWCSLIPQQGNLVNCWPFDTANTTSSSATDVKGSKNLALSNATLNGSGPSTNLNNAVVCNGTTTEGTSSLVNLPTAAFTLNIWLNDGNTGSGYTPIANGNPGTGGFRLLASTGNPIWGLAVGNGSTSATANSPGVVPSSWHMITFTWDGTTLTGYSDASAGTGAGFTGTLAAGNVDVGVYYNPSYSGDFFPGLIAGVAIWNTALTSGQISTLFGL